MWMCFVLNVRAYDASLLSTSLPLPLPSPTPLSSSLQIIFSSVHVNRVCFAADFSFLFIFSIHTYHSVPFVFSVRHAFAFTFSRHPLASFSIIRLLLRSAFSSFSHRIVNGHIACARSHKMNVQNKSQVRHSALCTHCSIVAKWNG